MILIDNYDSFTYNIVQYLQELGVKPKVFENDKISIEELKKINFIILGKIKSLKYNTKTLTLYFNFSISFNTIMIKNQY